MALTLKQEETCNKLGSLLGRSICTISGKNVNDNFAKIPERDRIGAPIKFYHVNKIEIKGVNLIETTDGTRLIQLNGDSKLVFPLNYEFDPFTDATKLTTEKVTAIDGGFFTDPIVAGELVMALNKESKLRIEAITKYLLDDLNALEGIMTCEESAIAAEKARRASNV